MYSSCTFRVNWQDRLEVKLIKFDAWLNKDGREVVCFQWLEGNTQAIVTFKNKEGIK